jgi:hypothetical protein
MKQTAVEWFLENLRNLIKESELTDMRPNEFDAREMELLEQAKEMEKEQQGKFTIDFINWLHLNQYKYNPKAKLYQTHFINETLFFSIDELFITFKQQDQ